MITCLQTPQSNPIFTDGPGGLGESPRFGWVPLMWNPTLGTGATNVTIQDFVPVFIQTTLWSCNASSCSLIWDPGEPVPPGPNNVKVEAATAIVLPDWALPDSLLEVEPGTAGQIRYLLSR